MFRVVSSILITFENKFLSTHHFLPPGEFQKSEVVVQTKGPSHPASVSEQSKKQQLNRLLRQSGKNKL